MKTAQENLETVEREIADGEEALRKLVQAYMKEWTDRTGLTVDHTHIHCSMCAGMVGPKRLKTSAEIKIKHGFKQ